MFTPEVIPAGPALLRPLADGDADAIVRACSDPLITRYIPSVPVPYTREDVAAFIKSAAEQWRQGGATFAVADPASGEWQGTVGLKPPDAHGGHAIGYMLAPWARGRGLATAAARAVTEYAFRNGAQRVELLADVENIASQRVAGAAGFRREGIRRGLERRRDGEYHDMVAFARLAADPGEPIRPYLPFPPGGELTDGVVRLVPITADDAPDFHAMMCDPLVLKYHVTHETPSLAEITVRCRMTGTWWLAGERAELAIRDAATGAFAGHIQLMSVSPLLGQAMIGYALLPAHRGRGFTTRAVDLLVSWAFEHTALSRLVAGTAPGNHASQAVLRRAGFTSEALIRGLLPGPDGTRMDDLQWARLRP
ncbi:N-acetyltransferase [Spongiactinospora rosea]|uniref:N-acetyltransferase n=1 Tax=Spongiactinospora rosea TaxID=2248750 RepID=A0A366M012_9ACTN|nr:GNAT family N-acetyltransferase [Spongiactinospora rosea]RBQ18939.1 N-acetyltransferase [Spongiactinospora rosea]